MPDTEREPRTSYLQLFLTLIAAWSPSSSHLNFVFPSLVPLPDFTSSASLAPSPGMLCLSDPLLLSPHTTASEATFTSITYQVVWGKLWNLEATDESFAHGVSHLTS